MKRCWGCVASSATAVAERERRERDGEEGLEIEEEQQGEARRSEIWGKSVSCRCDRLSELGGCSEEI